MGMIEWQPLESLKEIADVNLWGMICVTKTFLPLVKRARGRVINVGSILGESQVTLCKLKPYNYTCPNHDKKKIDSYLHSEYHHTDLASSFSEITEG